MNKSGSNSIIDERDIRGLIKILRNNWYVFLLFVGASLVVSTVVIHKTITIYASQATILLQGDQSYSMKGAVLSGLGIESSWVNVENEVQVIKSLPLIEKTVDKLDLEVSYFIQGRLKINEVYKNIPFKVYADVKHNSLFNVPFRLTVLSVDKYRLQFDSEAFDYDEELFFNDTINVRYFDMYIAPTREIAYDVDGKEEEKLTQYIFKITNKRDIVRKFHQSLKMEQFEWPAAYIKITLEDEIPERAIDFLDTLAQVYIDNSIEDLKMINENALLFIDEQLEEIVEELNEIELNIEQFKKNKVILTIENESKMYLSKLSDFEDIELNLRLKSKSLDYFKNVFESSTLDSEILLTPAMVDVEGFEEIRRSLKALIDLDLERRAVLNDKTKDSPSYKEIVSKISSIREDLIEYISLTQESLKNRLITIRGEVNKFKNLVKKIPKKEREIVNIERKLSINEDIYIYLLEKRAETIIAKSGIVSDKRVIEPARSLGVVSPDKNKIYMTNMGVGVALSLLLIGIRLAFTNTIDSKADLQDLTDLPILGMLGKNKAVKDNYLITEAEPRGAITEEFRSIRANLEYLTTNSPSKVILVTSYFPAEGKSFTCANLANLIAKTGKKVLLVSLDLHRPRLAKVFNIDNKMGIISYLAGQSSIKKIVNKTPIDNLDLVNTGPIPPNASELVLSPRLGEFMREARELYDYVIIDTPPIGILSDAIGLMRNTDINIYMVKAGYAKKHFVNAAHNVKDNIDPKNLCFVLNNVKRSLFNYGYGYDYSYTYQDEIEQDMPTREEEKQEA